jgi:hypothetical protein
MEINLQFPLNWETLEYLSDCLLLCKALLYSTSVLAGKWLTEPEMCSWMNNSHTGIQKTYQNTACLSLHVSNTGIDFSQYTYLLYSTDHTFKDKK